MSLLTPADLVALQATEADAFLHTCEIWRSPYDEGTGTSTKHKLRERDVPCSVFPGQRQEPAGSDSLATVGARDSFTGTFPLQTDLRVGDQLRNVTLHGTAVYGARKLVVGTLAPWPSVLAVRLAEQPQ